MDGVRLQRLDPELIQVGGAGALDFPLWVVIGPETASEIS